MRAIARQRPEYVVDQAPECRDLDVIERGQHLCESVPARGEHALAQRGSFGAEREAKVSTILPLGAPYQAACLQPLNGSDHDRMGDARRGRELGNVLTRSSAKAHERGARARAEVGDGRHRACLCIR